MEAPQAPEKCEANHVEKCGSAKWDTSQDAQEVLQAERQARFVMWSVVISTSVIMEG